MKVGKETEIYNNGYADGYEAAMRLEIPDPDYWTRLEHQYAGMAMQGFISSKRGLNIETDMYDIPYYSQMLAHALVEKLKSESNG
jgi:hypothetical protein